jgi:hypothetical protein
VESNTTLARPARSLIAGFLLVAIAALAVGWTAGTVAASGGSRAASPTPPGVDADGYVPATGNGTSGVQLGAPTTSGNTSAGIAFPVPGYNQLGVAPEGTIVAQGSGTAEVKTDGSDKAAALKKATDAALADAHDQAAAAAASMGVQLAAIYSISTQTSTNYTYPSPGCVIAPLTPGSEGGVSSSGGTGAAPASSADVCYPSALTTPTSGQLVVTLIVAYKFA